MTTCSPTPTETTTRVLTLSIPGEPQPKQRPRLGRGDHVYTPDATRSAESIIGWLFKQAYPGLEPLTGPVFVELVFRCSPGRTGLRKRGAGDIDNYTKLVFDALNHLAWADDAQIVDIHARVIRDSDDPGTDIVITEAP